MGFQINCEKNAENTLVLHLEGDLDVSSSPRLKSEFLDAYEADPGDVILDLAGLDYLDSTGLGVFLSILKRIRQEEHQLKMVHLKASIRKLFYITELDQEFDLEEPHESC